jgi:UDP-N-acetylglucosamine 3-dehydrogenase
MRRLNVAVLGCGSWGVNHARVYKGLRSADLVYVVDINIEVAKTAAELYGAASSSEPEDIFRSDDVDAVSICTPTVTHYELATRALKAGKHVLVEKPMAYDVAEAERLVKTAIKADRSLSVGFVERFNPAVVEVKRLVASGEVGELLTLNTKRVSRRPLRRGDVGVVKDLAIHDVDVASYIMGGQPVSVYACVGSISHGFEDYAYINLLYRGGRVALLEANWLTPRKVRSLVLTGSEGIINVEYVTQQLSIEKDTRVVQPINGFTEPLIVELSDFVGSILEGSQPQVTGVDGLNALKVCEAALESAHSQSVVYLGART